MTKNLLFVCATGIATSTAVAEKVMGFLKERGLTDVNYSQTNVASVQSNSDNADLIVSTLKIPYELDVPVINGLALITGINEDKVLNSIYSELTEGE
ncbi:PTS sugar transporter subunit IIB [Enterococcus durans]|uniref:PTS system galactitol-specific transporter subunit IIB n=1 Tax=Enterococcus durans TaxID=53345 RepID=A0A377KLR4_9ENTE|nr:PTS sugar transporter subunit IIB [Enterococcus durans]MBC9706834.1 PTS sugar transporter subunit IIB [Enterococcus sp.]MBX9041633.1 PTS sugar transporter subunit IIB [Enterococcus durans]MBX9078570.1 PTS sugar transporter subunit IIB [Enterococcus durans]MCB8504330.1 PTS sugar transporter subunit IIB [Enterococcus durans]MCB8515601.1 PTS sugar transporter subunit IIB [Enterococcus durans]